MSLGALPQQPARWIWTTLAWTAILAGLYLTKLHSYLLFHSLAESFSAVVALSAFAVFWNSREYIEDNWLVLLGIGFLSVGTLDLFHMLAFKDMGVFGAGADLPTQLWIAARYTEAGTLLAAVSIRTSRIRPIPALAFYMATTTVLLLAIFTGNFPECLTLAMVLTPFKIVSEYIICTVLVLALGLLYQYRQHYSTEVFRSIAAAVLLSIVSELAFTVYVSVSDLFNALGHLLKVLAFFFFYKAFIEQGLRRPFSLLFRDLKKREQALRQSEEEIRLITDSMPALISYVDAEGYYRFANRAYLEWFGENGDGIVGRHASEVLGEEVTNELQPYMTQVLRGEKASYTRRLFLHGGERFVHADFIPRYGEDGGVVGFFAMVHDITERVKGDEALRKSEAELRAYFEVSGSGMGQVDVHTGRFMRVNRTLCEMTGYSEEELLQMTFAEITHPEDRDRDGEVYRRVASGEKSGWTSEKRYVRKDGRVIWVEVSGNLIRDALGKPFRTAAVVRDITERKRIEEALRESEERFRVAITHAGVAVMTQDRDLRYTWAYNTVTGPPESVIGKRDIDILPLEDAKHFEQIKRQVLDTAEGAREVVQARIDGDTRIFDLTVEPLRNGHGSVVGITAAAFDITEQKRVEQVLRTLTATLEQRIAERTADLQRSERALRESEERLNLALRSAGLGTWNWNVKENTTYWDAYTHPLFGLDADSFRGGYREFLTHIHPEDRTDFEAEVERALTASAPFDLESRVVWPDETVHTLRFRGKVYRDLLGNVERMTGVCWDVTDRKRLEEALRQSERLAAVGQMITGLSHESRNALQRSRACLELLTRRLKENPKVLPLLEEATKAQMDLQRVYDEVRDYAGPINLELTPHRLPDIWGEVWTNLAAQRQDKEAVLLEEGCEKYPVCVVDRFRMQQVFRNLFENSLAAGGDNVTINIACASIELEGRAAWRIQIRDNGPGLNAEQSKRIFEPFYTTKTKGTGLGMAIVKRIIDSHGGRIHVDPGPGRGLEVTLELPCEQ